MMKDENDHSIGKRGSSAVGHTLEVVNGGLVNGYDKSPSYLEDDNTHITDDDSVTTTSRYLILLPWALLVASWLGFATFWLR